MADVTLEVTSAQINSGVKKANAISGWVTNNLVIAGTPVDYPTSEDINIDLSEYLPNDGHQYEIMFYTFLRTKKIIDAYIMMKLKTDIFATSGYVYAYSHAGEEAKSVLSSIIVVGAQRKLTIVASSLYKGTYEFALRGYRKVD